MEFYNLDNELVLKQIQLKKHCNKNEFFVYLPCLKCGKKHHYKLVCGSFFCETCQKKYSGRVKQRLMNYVYDCNHSCFVITIPKDLRHKLLYQDKSINKFYKCVDRAINRYFKQYISYTTNKGIKKYQKVNVGTVKILHSYGSKDLLYKPHLNVFFSSYGLTKCTKKYHKAVGTDSSNCKQKYHVVKTSYIDYTKLDLLIKEELSIIFNKNMDNPYKLCKFIGSFDSKNMVNKFGDYFRRIPFKIENIKNITNKEISFTTSKRVKQKMKPITLNHLDFYNRIIQHIPPQYFRGIRLGGLYSSNHKLKSISILKPINRNKVKEQLKCTKCKAILKIGFIAMYNQAIYIDTNIFNYKTTNEVKLMELIPKQYLPPDKIPYLGEMFNLQDLKNVR